MTIEQNPGTPVNVGRQLALMVEHGVDAAGRTRHLREVADLTGIRYQTLANLIQGRTASPRLMTLLALCRFYGISLDYFACETEATCQDMLDRHRISSASALISEIEQASNRLSARGKRNVLAIMEWMRSGMPVSGERP